MPLPNSEVFSVLFVSKNFPKPLFLLPYTASWRYSLGPLSSRWSLLKNLIKYQWINSLTIPVQHVQLTPCAHTSTDYSVSPVSVARTWHWMKTVAHAVPSSLHSDPCALAFGWRSSSGPWGRPSRNAPKTRTLWIYTRTERHARFNTIRNILQMVLCRHVK